MARAQILILKSSERESQILTLPRGNTLDKLFDFSPAVAHAWGVEAFEPGVQRLTGLHSQSGAQ